MDCMLNLQPTLSRTAPLLPSYYPLTTSSPPHHCPLTTPLLPLTTPSQPPTAPLQAQNLNAALDLVQTDKVRVGGGGGEVGVSVSVRMDE